MLNLHDQFLAMEKSHGSHKDPKLLESNTAYTKLGPLAVCKEMRQVYADQVHMKVWPTLATKIPEVNLGESKQLMEKAGL